MLPQVDIFSEYVSYGIRQNGEVASEGTVIFSYPKYFRYEDPHLSYRLEGDEIVVSADAYAKSVEIQNEAEDFLLSDNYFDLNGDEKRVKINSGEAKGIKLRSVYDIRWNPLISMGKLSCAHNYKKNNTGPFRTIYGGRVLVLFLGKPWWKPFGAMNLQNEESHSAISIDKTEKYQYIYYIEDIVK